MLLVWIFKILLEKSPKILLKWGDVVKNVGEYNAICGTNVHIWGDAWKNTAVYNKVTPS